MDTDYHEVADIGSEANQYGRSRFEFKMPHIPKLGKKLFNRHKRPRPKGTKIWRVVCDKKVRIRDAPRADAKQIGLLKPGKEIQELDRKEDWIKHRKGWTAIKSGRLITLEFVEVEDLQEAETDYHSPVPRAKQIKRRDSEEKYEIIPVVLPGKLALTTRPSLIRKRTESAVEALTPTCASLTISVIDAHLFDEVVSSLKGRIFISLVCVQHTYKTIAVQTSKNLTWILGRKPSCFEIDIEKGEVVSFEMMDTEAQEPVGNFRTIIYHMERNKYMPVTLRSKDRSIGTLGIKVQDGHVQGSQLLPQTPIAARPDSFAFDSPSGGGGMHDVNQSESGHNLSAAAMRAPMIRRVSYTSEACKVEESEIHPDLPDLKHAVKDERHFKLDGDHFYWPAMDVEMARQTVINWGSAYCLVHRVRVQQNEFFLTYCDAPPDLKTNKGAHIHSRLIKCVNDDYLVYHDVLEKPATSGPERDGVPLEVFIVVKKLNRIEPLTQDVLDKLDSYAFWVGSMGRENAIKLLAETGESSFLVRLSPNAQGLVVTVLYEKHGKKRTIHYIVERDSKGYRLIRGLDFYENLEDLLQYSLLESKKFQSKNILAYIRQNKNNPDRGSYYTTCYDDVGGV